MKHPLFVIGLTTTVLGLTTTIAFSAGETQSFSSPKANEQFVHESKNLQAFVRLNRKGTWCALQASIRLYIRDDSVFAGEQKELNTLLQELPGILRSQCNKIRASSIKAFIGNKPVYVASIKGIGGKPAVNGRITNQRIVTKYQQAVTPPPSGNTGTGPDQTRLRRGPRPGPRPQAPITIDTAPQQPPAQVAGHLFATAQTVGQQCDVLAEWISRFRQEYPSIEVSQYTSAETENGAANLFGDGHFVPVFGRPYSQFDAGQRSHIFYQIYRKCPREFRYKLWVGPIFRGAFEQSGFLKPANIAANVEKRREARAWLNEQNDQLDSIPSTAAGFNRLNGLATTGAARTSGLWPSEQTSFNSRVSVRKSEVALSVANDRIGKLPQEGESLSELKSIVAWAEPHVIDADRPQFAALTGLADGRRQEIRVALVERELATLPAYPNTIRSLKQILDRRNWLAKTVGKSPPLPVFDRFEQSKASRSDEIARAALPAYQADLNRFPGTLAGATKALADFATISDLLETTALAHKAAYRQVAVRRADRIYDDLIAEAVANVRSTNGGWRDAVGLIASARGEVAKFRGTRARERASQIGAAARLRAESLAKSDLATFKRELKDTVGSWDGYARLGQIRQTVGDNQQFIPALAEYRPLVAVRRSEIVSVLTQMALADIKSKGKDFEGVAWVEFEAAAHRALFSAAGEGESVKQVNTVLAARVSQLIQGSLPRFKKELAERESTRKSAAELQDLAVAFDEQARKWVDFKPYADAARLRSDEVLVTVCDVAVERAGLSSADEKEGILGVEKGMTLREFVCGLDEQGHQVSEIASPGTLQVKGGYTMRVFQSNGEFVHATLRKIEALPGQDLLVGFAYGDVNLQNDITVIEWQSHMASLQGLKGPLGFATNTGSGTQEIAARLQRSVAFVLWWEPGTVHMGSGFFITPNLLVTNRHVVDEADPNEVFITSAALGKLVKGKVVGTSGGRIDFGARDYALISFDEPLQIDPLTVASVTENLAPVVTAGYPGFFTQDDPRYARLVNNRDVSDHVEMVFSTGEVSVVREGSYGIPLVIHSAEFSQGNSGGPLVDLCGRVVGINTYHRSDDKSRRVAFYSLAGSDLIEFLGKMGVDGFQTTEEPCRN